MKREQGRAFLLRNLFVCLLVLALTQVSGKAFGNLSDGGSSQADARPELVAQLGHFSSVRSAVFSSDGKFVLTASHDDIAILWDAESGKEIRRFIGHANGLASAILSPDGKQVLAISQSRFLPSRIWDAESGREIHKLENQSAAFTSGIFSPDGKYVLTVTWVQTAQLWDVASGREIRRFEKHPAWLKSNSFSPDGKYLLTASQNTVWLWEIESGREIRKFEGHSGGVMSSIFSPDRKHVLTASSDKTARIWDAESGREIRRFEGHSGSINSAIFSPHGKYILTASSDKTARLWEVESGKEVRRLEGHSNSVRSVIFSPDEKYVLTESDDTTSRLWEVESGKQIRKFRDSPGFLPSANFSPDGKYVLLATSDDASLMSQGSWARLLDVTSGREVRRFEGHSGSINSAIFSPDEKYVLTRSGSLARLWDIASGKEIRRFKGHDIEIATANFSSSGKYLLTASFDNTARLWDVASGKEIRKFEIGNISNGDDGRVISAAFSPDGKYVLTANINLVRSWQGLGTDTSKKYNVGENSARLWDAATGRVIHRLVMPRSATLLIFQSLKSAIFSADGKYVLTSQANTARLWDVASGRELRKFEKGNNTVISAIFSVDGKYVLTNQNNIVCLWEIESGKEIRRFEGHPEGSLSSLFNSSVRSVTLSPDGKYLLTAGDDGTARLWEVESGKEIRRFEGHSYLVNSATFSADGKYVLTASWDGTSRFWSASTGKQLCQLISFRDGNWAVVAPDGRFDASNLEEIKGLNWVMPNDPMKPLPVEIFMRDYYEPRLLPRILNGEQFKPISSIATLNRVQPEVSITAITPQKDHSDLATVTVKVSRATGEFKEGDKKITRETGVYDLRLFRNGQLVAQLPPPDPSTNEAANKADATPEQMRKAWREQARVKLEANGEQIVTFNNIRLPRRADQKQVEFTAYAFNEDRIKSRTDKKAFDIAKDLAPVKGRAYVLTVGANAYENRAWNLRFAVNDARLARRALYEGLRQSGQFEEVVNVSLISDAQPTAGTQPATKANVKAALSEIARQARPEDLVMIYYSSHGYADQSGNYYFFTQDTGPGNEKAITPELLRRSISSDELSTWLKDVDAGDIALIIDACQSAGTVKGEAGGDFKPGPMGSRGLGQLAYDKGMLILAASQADDFAFETATLQHGLLTYALMKNGVEGRKSDLNKDGRITLDEALAYALARVPKLYEAMRRGELAEMFKSEGGRGPQVVGEMVSLRRKSAFQQPSLFDFAKKRKEIVLVR